MRRDKRSLDRRYSIIFQVDTDNSHSTDALVKDTDVAKPNLDKVADINIKIYESARAELIQRIILRDGALLFYIGAIGTYFKEVITAQFDKTSGQIELDHAILAMVPLPIVCLVFSLIIVQHHMTIGRLGAFLRAEIEWGPLSPYISKHWDNSKSFLDNANFLIVLRLYGQGLILCVPLIYDVYFFFKFKHSGALFSGVNIVLLVQLMVNVAVSLLIGGLHVFAHVRRKGDWDKFLPPRGTP